MQYHSNYSLQNFQYSNWYYASDAYTTLNFKMQNKNSKYKIKIQNSKSKFEIQSQNSKFQMKIKNSTFTSMHSLILSSNF